MKTRKIVHIHLKKKNEDVYYTSMRKFFNDAGIEATGITDQAVKNYMSENKTDVYENDFIRVEKNITLHLDTKKREKPTGNVLSKNEMS